MLKGTILRTLCLERKQRSPSGPANSRNGSVLLTASATLLERRRRSEPCMVSPSIMVIMTEIRFS